VLCASTIESLRLLLHSSEGQQERGLIDPSAQLGRGLMDHISCSRFFSIPGIAPPDLPAELSGAGSCFVPNCRAVGEPQRDFERGYGLWAALQRFDPPRLLQRRPGEAVGFLIGHGEVLANPDNQVTLDGGPGDAWGLPVARIT
jgi:hypothetical protein